VGFTSERLGLKVVPIILFIETFDMMWSIGNVERDCCSIVQTQYRSRTFAHNSSPVIFFRAWNNSLCFIEPRVHTAFSPWIFYDSEKEVNLATKETYRRILNKKKKETYTQGLFWFPVLTILGTDSTAAYI
jgi:hypothetical protein